MLSFLAPFLLAPFHLAPGVLAPAVAAQDGEAAQEEEAKKGPGPAERESWKVIRPRPGPSSDTFSLKSPTEGLLVEGTILQASSRTAFIAYQGGGPYRGTTFRDVIVRVEPGTLELDRSYWAVRAYDMIDTTFERVEITGFGRVTPQHDEGHALYLNVAGSLAVLDCDVHHNGGQGVQLVNRPHESVLPPGPAEGTIEIRRSRFAENGFNPDRGGFQVSIFGTGQAIVLEDVEITAGFDDTVWPQGRTGGALVIEAEGPSHDPRRQVWWRPKELPEDFVTPFTQGRTELLGVVARHRDPNKPLVQIKGCAELVVRGCELSGGVVELDDPRKPGRDCGRIVWEENRGDAVVFHRGQRVGLASDDFVVEPPPTEGEGGGEDEGGAGEGPAEGDGGR